MLSCYPNCIANHSIQDFVQEKLGSYLPDPPPSKSFRMQTHPSPTYPPTHSQFSPYNKNNNPRMKFLQIESWKIQSHLLWLHQYYIYSTPLRSCFLLSSGSLTFFWHTAWFFEVIYMEVWARWRLQSVKPDTGSNKKWQHSLQLSCSSLPWLVKCQRD